MRYCGIIGIVLLMCGCSSFDKKDKALIYAGLSLTVIDAYQTKRVLESDEFKETSHLMQHKGDIIPVMLATDLIVIGSSSFLTDKWQKRLLTYWIGLKWLAVGNNYHIGVR